MVPKVLFKPMPPNTLQSPTKLLNHASYFSQNMHLTQNKHIRHSLKKKGRRNLQSDTRYVTLVCTSLCNVSRMKIKEGKYVELLLVCSIWVPKTWKHQWLRVS